MRSSDRYTCHGLIIIVRECVVSKLIRYLFNQEGVIRALEAVIANRQQQQQSDVDAGGVGCKRNRHSLEEDDAASSAPTPMSNNGEFDQRVKVLEQEAEELRRKLACFESGGGGNNNGKGAEMFHNKGIELLQAFQSFQALTGQAPAQEDVIGKFMGMLTDSVFVSPSKLLELQAELEEARRGGGEIERLNNQLENACSVNDSLRSKLEAARRANDSLEDMLDKLHGTCKVFDVTFSALGKRVDVVITNKALSKAKFDAKAKELSNEVNDLIVKRLAADTQNRELAEEIHTRDVFMQSCFDKFSVIICDLEDQISRGSVAVDSLKAESDARKARVAELDAQVESQGNDIVKLARSKQVKD